MIFSLTVPLLPSSRIRQTFLGIIFVLCIGCNLYILSLKTNVWTQPRETQRTRTNGRMPGDENNIAAVPHTRNTGQIPCNNCTPQQMQENLKLSLEISVRLSKILSDALEVHQSIPDLKMLSNEVKKLRDKTEVPVDRTERFKTRKKSLLTLFTTMNENNTHRSLINNNTIRNWASLRPMVTPVLFTDNDTFRNYVTKEGWETLPLQKLGVDGMPILKYMYLAAVENFRSDFYAFSNSDILFNGGLLKTLVTAKYSYDLETSILITGTRYNVPNITDNEAKERANLINLAKGRGELFLPWAADYFITTPSFPWKDIPEVIIGALAYDNWIILHAREKKFVVIDATKTAPAVHQTPIEGNFESHFKGHALHDYYVLSNAFPNKTIDYKKGQVVCTEIVSSLVNENIIFEKRAETMPHCSL